MYVLDYIYVDGLPSLVPAILSRNISSWPDTIYFLMFIHFNNAPYDSLNLLLRTYTVDIKYLPAKDYTILPDLPWYLADLSCSSLLFSCS